MESPDGGSKERVGNREKHDTHSFVHSFLHYVWFGSGRLVGQVLKWVRPAPVLEHLTEKQTAVLSGTGAVCTWFCRAQARKQRVLL